MGMALEFNWFMVVASQDKIVSENGIKYTVKSAKRIYPVGFQIPLIIKKQGCIGMIKVLKTVIDEHDSCIFFEVTEQFKPDDAVATHYYERYLDFKRREKDINP